MTTATTPDWDKMRDSIYRTHWEINQRAQAAVSPWGPLTVAPRQCRTNPPCSGDAFCRCRNCKPALRPGQHPSDYRRHVSTRAVIGWIGVGLVGGAVAGLTVLAWFS